MFSFKQARLKAFTLKLAVDFLILMTSAISQTSTVVLDEEQEPSVTENQSSIDGGIPARYNDVVKIILNFINLHMRKYRK